MLLRTYLILLILFFSFTGLFSQAPFITIWQTDNPGISEDHQITIPGTGSEYLIEWEEVDNPGNNGSLIGTGFTTITFTTPGIYQVSISGDFTRIRFNGGLNCNEADCGKLLSIEQWGEIEWECMGEAFSGCTNMEYHATDIPDLSRVESMSAMFKYCSRFNGYINEWDVSNVVDMSQMFFAALNYSRSMNLWDVSNVETMEEMFLLAREFRSNIFNWDTGSVTNMRRMFMDARRFNNTIGDWNVSNVTNFEEMFYRALSFNKNINDWNLSSAENMKGMFRDAESFNQPLDNWSFPNIEDRGLEGLFLGASAFNQNINTWDVSHINSLSDLLHFAVSFNQPLDNWDVSNVEVMIRMFYGTFSFDQPLDNWDVSNVIVMGSMFSRATSFNQPLDSWDVSNVIIMGDMFGGATSFNQPLGNWDVSKVKDMGSMFSIASSFNQPLNGWDVSNVEWMTSMFSGAVSFNQPLDNWNVSKVKDMGSMFSWATTFDQNLGKWYLSGIVIDLKFMFDHSGMSCENYDLTLIGWSENPNTPDNRTLGAVGVHYWQAEEARAKLIDEKGWSITGDEFVEECITKDCDLPTSTLFIKSPYPACKGEEVLLKTEVDGAEYTWFKDGQLIIGENEQVLVVTEAGFYSVIYTDEDDCESEESDALEVSFLDDTSPPVLLNGEDAVLRSTQPNCRGFAFWEAEIEVCGDLSEIENRSLWRLDLHNTGQFDIVSNQPRPDGSLRDNLRIEEELPFGTHRLQWDIRDEHGNIVIEEQLLTLVDMNPPNPVCLHGISTNLSPNTGTITIPASVFDVNSWDDCTASEDLHFTFSSDLSHTHHTWNCDDLDGESEVTFTVEIWVTNEYGHQNHCVTYLKVQDNREVCPHSGILGPVGNRDQPTSAGQSALLSSEFSELEEEQLKYSTFELKPNRPNPFTSHTSIGFDLPEPGRVELMIYHPYGQSIYRQSRDYSSGSHDWELNGGEFPSTGMYIYRLGFEGEYHIGRMLRIE